MLAPLAWYIVLSAVLFSIGVFGFLFRKNPLIMFMSIELMLNGVNLAFLSFSSLWNNGDGQIFTFLVMTVAAAEAVVGLGIIIALFRPRARVDIDDIDELRG